MLNKPTQKKSKDVVIDVKHVAKYFAPSAGQRKIKDVFTNVFIKDKRAIKKGYHALNDISFDVKKGEFFGIVGRNGSGKSTLLKMIAGIYTPTKGAISVSGRLVPFIELGVGFNAELSGKDNVYLNGALLGFSRKEISAMYDEIVAFAELEEHMDVKLKNYSSGMQVRLAFSIAIKADSDVLLIDEVLAVGDANFQKKCLEVFENYKKQNKTVVLVTHDMNSVRRFCDRAMLIAEGNVVDIGMPSKIASTYTQLNQQGYDNDIDAQNKNKIKLTKPKLELQLSHADATKSVGYKTGEKIILDFTWPAELMVKNLGAAVLRENGEFLFGCNTINLDLQLENLNKYTCEIHLRLGPGKYHFMYGAFGTNEFDVKEFIDDGPSFTIQETKLDWEGLLYMESKWYR